MSVTLEELQQAATTLGLTAKRKEGALDVRLRPLTHLRIRQGANGLETETRVGGPGWLSTLRMWLVGVGLGLYFAWHRPPRFDEATLIVLFFAALILGESAWVSFLSSRTREKLFTRAYEMEQGSG
jgi:hypothetical protein